MTIQTRTESSKKYIVFVQIIKFFTKSHFFSLEIFIKNFAVKVRIYLFFFYETTKKSSIA